MVKQPAVCGIVLAAGESKRMGLPKLVLPWGNNSVIGHIIEILQHANIDDVLVVTGGWRDEVESAVGDYSIGIVFNPMYRQGDMLSSVKVGLSSIKQNIDAALITLGDQPFIELEVVQSLLETYISTRSKLVVPSYKMQRGHPWLVDKALWKEILKIDKGRSLRDFLSENNDLIKYVPVKTNSILLDLDTKDDFYKYRPA